MKGIDHKRNYIIDMSIFKRIYSKIQSKKKSFSFYGDFATFKEAEELCGAGYSDEEIFNKVKDATLAVVNGEAAYERDSCLFYEKSINYNLLMYLYMCLLEEGRLNVCDWGGALGSTFFQHRELLEKWKCSWTVLEQPHFVQFGKEKLAGESLKFANCLDEIEDINCFLFSAVLYYIENYEDVISASCKRQPAYIIIERTPVAEKGRIWIETVHEPIYEAKYPCYVFVESELIKKFEENGYHLIDSWHSLIEGDVPVSKDMTVIFKSFVFKRKT